MTLRFISSSLKWFDALQIHRRIFRTSDQKIIYKNSSTRSCITTITASVTCIDAISPVKNDHGKIETLLISSIATEVKLKPVGGIRSYMTEMSLLLNLTKRYLIIHFSSNEIELKLNFF